MRIRATLASPHTVHRVRPGDARFHRARLRTRLYHNAKADGFRGENPPLGFDERRLHVRRPRQRRPRSAMQCWSGLSRGHRGRRPRRAKQPRRTVRLWSRPPGGSFPRSPKRWSLSEANLHCDPPRSSSHLTHNHTHLNRSSFLRYSVVATTAALVLTPLARVHSKQSIGFKIRMGYIH